MAINVSQAFHRTSANPVDESLALTKAQMLTVNDNLMPAYYFTICQDDGKIYLYDKTATPSVTTGKFSEFQGGGGGGTASAFTITITNNGSSFSADKTPAEVEAAVANGDVLQASFPTYGLVLSLAVSGSGTYVFSTMYTEGTASTTAFCSIALTKGSASAWSSIDYQTIMGDALGGGSSTAVVGTLLASGWNSTTRQQTLTFTGLANDSNGTIGVPTSATAAQKSAYADAVINVVAQSGTSLTFEAETIPSIDLPVLLILV